MSSAAGGGASVVDLTEESETLSVIVCFLKLWNLLHHRHQTVGGSCQVGPAGVLGPNVNPAGL